MATTEVIEAIPLAKDASGVYRAGRTRVTLDLVARAFNNGATPEGIALRFPSVELADVYQVVGYYLRHSAELAGYFEQREKAEAERLANHRAEWRPRPRGLRAAGTVAGAPEKPEKWLADENLDNAIRIR